ncbi:hypothetical protein ACFFLM_05015 [Deinococcus oregonensis]|uniref:DUF7669 domain-containing protein n=1 Tax=Deinococcus oregonensis TaxID=1805970 RepID=A0ABV6AUZ9_9DEIO
MTCRDEILETVNALVKDRTPKTFHISEVVSTMRANKTKYPVSTIRAHISSVMCQSAPKPFERRTYPDFKRVARGRYRLL